MLQTNLALPIKRKASKVKELANKSLSHLAKGIISCFPVRRDLMERLAKTIGVDVRILQLSIDSYRGVQYHNLFGEDERISYEQ